MNTLVKMLVHRGVKYAVFDIDSTISQTNILKTYVFIKKNRLKNKLQFCLWYWCWLLLAVPMYICMDFFSRDFFLKYFYKKFKTIPYSELSMLCENYFALHIPSLFIEDTIKLMNLFKQSGVEIILVSLGISPLVKQYAQYFHATYHCIEFLNDNGRISVNVENVKNFKLNFVKQYSADEVVAVADSKHDRAMLSYCKNSIIIAGFKVKPWMRAIKGATVFCTRRPTI